MMNELSGFYGTSHRCEFRFHNKGKGVQRHSPLYSTRPISLAWRNFRNCLHRKIDVSEASLKPHWDTGWGTSNRATIKKHRRRVEERQKLFCDTTFNVALCSGFGWYLTAPSTKKRRKRGTVTEWLPNNILNNCIEKISKAKTPWNEIKLFPTIVEPTRQSNYINRNKSIS